MSGRFGKQVSWSVSLVENGVGLVAERDSGKHQQKLAFHTWLLMALNKSVQKIVKTLTNGPATYFQADCCSLGVQDWPRADRYKWIYEAPVNGGK